MIRGDERRRAGHLKTIERLKELTPDPKVGRGGVLPPLTRQ
jgi:hypothetical protein